MNYVLEWKLKIHNKGTRKKIKKPQMLKQHGDEDSYCVFCFMTSCSLVKGNSLAKVYTAFMFRVKVLFCDTV